jgi:hypothetical protein
MLSLFGWSQHWCGVLPLWTRVCSGNIAGVEGKPAIFDPATYFGACVGALLRYLLACWLRQGLQASSGL